MTIPTSIVHRARWRVARWWPSSSQAARRRRPQERVHASPPRTAVLAGADAPSAAVTAVIAARRRRRHRPPRRGILDAQAQATRLAAEGYEAAIGVGAQARAAVSQAAAGEVGDDTDWQIAAH